MKTEGSICKDRYVSVLQIRRLVLLPVKIDMSKLMFSR